MGKNIRIMVVDDHQVVREGLRRLLELEADLKVVGEAANAKEALNQVESLSPDVILMDIKIPEIDGIELTKQIKQKHPSSNIIILTLYDEYLTQAMEAGANGYLVKDIKRDELTQAIRRVYQGQVVISESIISKTQFEQEDKYGKESEEDAGRMIEEVQLILPPPVEANQLMRFAEQAQEALKCRVLQVIGSWQEGTAIITVLDKAIPPEDILDKLGKIPEIEAIEEKAPQGKSGFNLLLKKAAAIPNLKSRTRKTIFVTLKRGLEQQAG